MYAKVENNQIVKANSNLGVFGLSPETTVAQREAQGVYEIIYDNTNLKDSRYYWNGAESMVFANNAVTASYAPATGKDVEDKDAVDSDGNNVLDDDGNQVIIPGLKTIFKNEVKAQAKGLLSPSDWYIIRKAEDAESTQPGINKQITETQAEGQWTDCDNVRFRYGIPEKIGGWKQLGDSNLTGAGRGLHHFVNSSS